MHISRLSVRFLGLLAAVFAIMLAFGSAGQGPQDTALAAGDLTSLSCADMYVDIPPFNAKGDPAGPQGEDVWAAKSLTRIEPSVSSPGDWDMTSVAYIGPDFDDNQLPDKPPSALDCQQKTDGNELNPSLKYQQVDVNDRPGTVGTVVTKSFDYSLPEDGSGDFASCLDGIDNGGDTVADFDDPDCLVQGDALVYTTCTLSESTGQWTRIDVNSTLPDKDPLTKNFGQVILFTDTGSPNVPPGDPGFDPTTCDISGAVMYQTAFPSILVSHTRADDDPGSPVPDLTATDWDGDGCSDWDELAQAPNNLGRDPFNPTDCDHNYNGVYNILATVEPATKDTTGTYFHCISRIEHDKHTQALDVNLVCYQDSKGLSGDSAVPTRADGMAGAPPPPPYTGAEPVKLQGQVTGKPQAHYMVPYFGAQAADTVDFWFLWTPEKPGQQVSSVTVVALGLAPPCPDGQEIVLPTDKLPDPNSGALADHAVLSFFPEKCILPDTLFDITVEHTAAVGNPPILSHVLWTNAGQPLEIVKDIPPDGTFQPATTLTFSGCFDNLGPPLGPNVIIAATLDGKTMKGTLAINGIADDNECAAKSGGFPLIAATLEMSEQSRGPDGLLGTNDDFDHDEDGCTDWDELGHDKAPPTSKKCGDDPYNPYDSPNLAGDLSGSYSTLAIVNGNGAKHAKATGGLPGGYFHCVTEIDHDTATNDLTASIYCYTDSVLLDDNGTTGDPNDDTLIGIGVNFEDSGTVVCDPVPVGTPVDTTKCGDGHPGPNPPGPAGNGTRTWGDVDDPHTVLTGTYDKKANVMRLEGCYENVENPTQGPNVYVRAVIPAHAGNGTTDIWLNRPDCTKPASEPDAPYNDVVTESARNSDQVDLWDTDQDGCTNAEELASGAGSEATGGLRDPYNYWDFRDVPSGTPPVRDAVVSVGDISAVVGVFGTSGTATLDPVNTPVTGGYHTAYDTGGGIVGSAGTWNVRGPDGAISVGDITAIVNQFGHAC